MAERTERGVLNTLIVACRDAERGFAFAAEHVQDPSVRALFTEFAAEHRRHADAMVPHARRLGGEGEAEGSRLASLHRTWMAIRDRVSHDDHAVVLEADRGEKTALAVYNAALHGPLPPDTRDLVEAQAAAIRGTLERLHAVHVVAA